jgi:hypothetical protein
MPLQHTHLDDRTRALMLKEIERDINAGNLYLSENLSQQGCTDYPRLLRVAAERGSDATFAEALRACLNSHEKPRKLKSGDYSKPPVMRSNAHEMLAEGEFNRFYMRGLCLRVMEDGIKTVVVYRAKEVSSPRSQSEQMLGKQMAAEALLQDLRAHVGVDTALGLPPGPNSGLCIRLPQHAL